MVDIWQGIIQVLWERGQITKIMTKLPIMPCPGGTGRPDFDPGFGARAWRQGMSQGAR